MYLHVEQQLLLNSYLFSIHDHLHVLCVISTFELVLLNNQRLW